MFEDLFEVTGSNVDRGGLVKAELLAWKLVSFEVKFQREMGKINLSKAESLIVVLIIRTKLVQMSLWANWEFKWEYNKTLVRSKQATYMFEQATSNFCKPTLGA